MDLAVLGRHGELKNGLVVFCPFRAIGRLPVGNPGRHSGLAIALPWADLCEPYGLPDIVRASRFPVNSAIQTHPHVQLVLGRRVSKLECSFFSSSGSSSGVAPTLCVVYFKGSAWYGRLSCATFLSKRLPVPASFFEAD